MKQFRILFGLVVLFAGLGLSSCNDSKNDSTQFWSGVVKVNSDKSFTTQNGVRLVPDVPASLNNVNMAFIYCRIVGKLPSSESNSQSVQMLIDPQPIDRESYVRPEQGGADNIVSNAAICSMNIQGQRPFFFDSRTLVLPIEFFLKDTGNATDQKAELARHKFVLCCYLDTISSGDTELKFYLRHIIDGDVTPARFARNGWNFNAYDISDALSNFTLKSGTAKPSKIVIHTEENYLSDELGTGHSQPQSYPLTYSFE